MTSARGLYTPDILAAAMELTAYPWDEMLPLKGAARSRSCGSAIELGVALDSRGHIRALGLKPHACAVGQAAASIFAKSAVGRDRDAILAARQAVALWLTESGDEPDWPGMALLEPARAYPARHGAILLAWDAALDAIDK